MNPYTNLMVDCTVFYKNEKQIKTEMSLGKALGMLSYYMQKESTDISFVGCRLSDESLLTFKGVLCEKSI